jgi:hypothetical protein
VQPDHRGRKVYKVLKDRKALLVLLVVKALKVLLVHKDQLDHRDLSALLVVRVHKELKDRPVQQVRRELKD